MTMNGYLSEGHRTAKDVISTIVHTSCNSNKCRPQSAPKLEALSRLSERARTHTHHGYHQTVHLDQTAPL